MLNLCPFNFKDEEKLLQIDSPLIDRLDYLKSFQFSTDGYFSISSTESNYVVIHSINNHYIYDHEYYESSFHRNDNDWTLQNSLLNKIFIGESIYDLKWNPKSSLSTSSSFIVTSRDHPIQLWDINSGLLKSSYHGQNHLDELDCSISLAFNIQGTHIYAGYNRMIRSFDIEYPGKESIQTATSETRKSPYGQKGIISALSFNPDYSGLYAAGSYSHSIGIYAENNKVDDHVMLYDNIDFGVTCIKWSPCGNYIWAGGRKHSKIYCWDIRSTQTIIGSIDRCLNTNQRMNFDIDPWGKYIMTGTQNGNILFYDTTSFELIKTINTSNYYKNDDEYYHNFNDQCSCVNSVMFHPYSSIIGATIGERCFYPTSTVIHSNDITDTSDSDEEQNIHNGINHTINIDKDPVLTNNNKRKINPNETLSMSDDDTNHNNDKIINDKIIDNKNNTPFSTISLWGIPRIPIKIDNLQTSFDS